ncbi:MAG TPA: serine protease [Polyangiaceae bacterium]|nr:serine protease [Polyangiaceae bacterium]
MGPGRKLVLAFASFASGALFCGVGAAQVTYSAIDKATVRVFAAHEVTTRDVTTKSGRSYRLAVPESVHGSGVRVAPDGLILTAYHVVEHASFVAVMGPADAHARPASVVFADQRHDYAFVYAGGPPSDAVSLPAVAPSVPVRSTVYAVGYPLDADRKQPQSNRGIIAGALRDGSLQLDIAVNPGNSGGPVTDEHEALLGIVVARGDPRKGVEGIGVAVPLDPILEGYRTLGAAGGPLERARRRVARWGDAGWAKADLVAAITSRESVLGMVREATARIAGGPGEDAPVIGPRLEDALARTQRSDADVLVLAAAFAWNGAAVARDLGRDDYPKRLRLARTLCEAAVRLDTGVRARSPFVATVLDAE